MFYNVLWFKIIIIIIIIKLNCLTAKTRVEVLHGLARADGMGCGWPDVSESARSASRQLVCTSTAVCGGTEDPTRGCV